MPSDAEVLMTRATFASLLVAVTAPAAIAGAQITTSSIAGRVTGESGAGIGDVTVAAIHVPTGARYGVQTNADGRFFLPNLRPGGPYQIVVRRIGYRPEQREDVALTLGQTTRFEFKLEAAAAS